MARVLFFIVFLIVSPIYLLISIVIVIDDGFPIFFKQKRIGLNNKPFMIYKFRTMKTQTPNMATHLLNNPERYFTDCGPFLRKFSLDEIPQVFNLLKNNIALIGPRPALYNQYDLISRRTKLGIHKIMPGLTGWAQINGRDSLSIDEKISYDLYYLKNKSLWLNIKIIWYTILKVVKADDVSV